MATIRSWKLFPVPADDTLFLISENGGTLSEIIVTDLTGRHIFTTFNSTSVDVSQLTAGTYFLTVVDQVNTVTMRFVKD